MLNITFLAPVYNIAIVVKNLYFMSFCSVSAEISALPGS